MSFRYVFGPVRSGRLGVSLGLDLLGAKICSMDCLYCEVCPTRALTLERRPWVPAQTILEELRRWAAEGHPRPDHVTLGGMGEPTLNSDMAAVITGCREILPGVPVAVLTNSSLMPDRQVRAELALADVVLPSLDSLVPEEFERLNRPAPGIGPAAVAASILDFRREFAGRIYLEVLLSAGINDTEENLERLREYVARLAPDRVDVVTLTRPGAYPEARAVSRETLARFAAALTAAARSGRLGESGSSMSDDADAQTEPGSPQDGTQLAAPHAQTRQTLAETILASIRRRPQTEGQLACALDLPADDVRGTLDSLAASGRVTRLASAEADGEPFYAPVRRDSDNATAEDDGPPQTNFHQPEVL